MTSPAALAAGALAAAGVLFLLWPEERQTAAGRARATLFALLAAIVACSLLSRQADRMGSPSTARAFEAYTRGLDLLPQSEIGYLGRAVKDESPTLIFPSGIAPADHIFGASRAMESTYFKKIGQTAKLATPSKQTRSAMAQATKTSSLKASSPRTNNPSPPLSPMPRFRLGECF